VGDMTDLPFEWVKGTFKIKREAVATPQGAKNRKWNKFTFFHNGSIILIDEKMRGEAIFEMNRVMERGGTAILSTNNAAFGPEFIASVRKLGFEVETQTAEKIKFTGTQEIMFQSVGVPTEAIDRITKKVNGINGQFLVLKKVRTVTAADRKILSKLAFPIKGSERDSPLGDAPSPVAGPQFDLRDLDYDKLPPSLFLDKELDSILWKKIEALLGVSWAHSESQVKAFQIAKARSAENMDRLLEKVRLSPTEALLRDAQDPNKRKQRINLWKRHWAPAEGEVYDIDGQQPVSLHTRDRESLLMAWDLFSNAVLDALQSGSELEEVRNPLRYAGQVTSLQQSTVYQVALIPWLGILYDPWIRRLQKKGWDDRKIAGIIGAIEEFFVSFVLVALTGYGLNYFIAIPLAQAFWNISVVVGFGFFASHLFGVYKLIGGKLGRSPPRDVITWLVDTFFILILTLVLRYIFYVGLTSNPIYLVLPILIHGLLYNYGVAFWLELAQGVAGQSESGESPSQHDEKWIEFLASFQRIFDGVERSYRENYDYASMGVEWIRNVIRALKEKGILVKGTHLIDLGSGIGPVVHLTNIETEAEATGIEKNWHRLQTALAITTELERKGVGNRNRIHWIEGEFSRDVDLSEYDVIYAHLRLGSSAVNPDHIVDQMKDGAVLVYRGGRPEASLAQGIVEEIDLPGTKAYRKIPSDSPSAQEAPPVRTLDEMAVALPTGGHRQVLRSVARWLKRDRPKDRSIDQLMREIAPHGMNPKRAWKALRALPREIRLAGGSTPGGVLQPIVNFITGLLNRDIRNRFVRNYGLTDEEFEEVVGHVEGFLVQHGHLVKESANEILQSFAEPDDLALGLSPTFPDPHIRRQEIVQARAAFDRVQGRLINDLSKTTRVKIFAGKLMYAERENHLLDFLRTATGDPSLKTEDISIEDIRDASSGRAIDAGHVLYRIDVKMREVPATIYLKTMGKVEYEEQSRRSGGIGKCASI